MKRSFFSQNPKKSNTLNEKLKGKKVFRFIFYLILAIALSSPAYLLTSSSIMRFIDNAFNDAVLQKEYKQNNPYILLVTVSYEDISNIGGYEKLPEAIIKFTEKVNSDPKLAPSVVAINLSEIEDKYTDSAWIKNNLGYDNLVFGYDRRFNNASRVQDDSLLTSPYTLYSNDTINSFTNILKDKDGIIRHYVYESENDKGKSIDSFAKQVYETYLKETNAERNEFSLSSDQVFPIAFMHAPGKYNSCSLSEILSNDISLSNMSGKIIFFGFSDTSMTSGYATALDRNSSMSNIEIQANVVDSIMNGQVKKEVPILLQALIMTAFSIVMIMFMLYNNPNGVIWCYILILISSVSSAFILWKLGYITYSLCIIVDINVLGIIAVIRFMIFARKNSINVNKMLSHYIDPNIINDMSKDDKAVDMLHGDNKKIAVMFADIRNYTGMSEFVGADESVEILNGFLGIAADCIMANGGTLDKYIGDCVMAFWGAPQKCEDAAYIACKTALEIAEKAKPLCDEIAEKYNRGLSFGIGINYGEAVVGNIGSATRMDYTAIGDTVNLASRLEADAPRGNIYISESVYQALKGRGSCKMISKTIRIKGKINPVTVYSLYSLSSEPHGPITVETKVTEEASYSIKFFGTRGSYPLSGARYAEFGGNTTCMILKNGKNAIIVDCGTGFYHAKEFLKDCTKIDVLFSHMHYDHILGLLKLDVFPKDCEIHFYGNFSLWKNGRVFDDLFSDPFWPYNPNFKNLIDVKREEPYTLMDGTRAMFYEAPHPNSANLITLESTKGKRICVMVDCESPEGLPFAKVSGTDLLVYDGMFAPEDYKGHEGWGHSTYKAACSLASVARVKYLIVTHHNPLYSDSKLTEMEKEAKLLFPDMSFAKDGAEFVI